MNSMEFLEMIDCPFLMKKFDSFFSVGLSQRRNNTVSGDLSDYSGKIIAFRLPTCPFHFLRID